MIRIFKYSAISDTFSFWLQTFYQKITHLKFKMTIYPLSWCVGALWPSRDITHSLYMISTGIFRVKSKTSDSRELNQASHVKRDGRDQCLSFCPFLLVAKYILKNATKSFWDTYISFNDNKISFTNKLSTKVQFLGSWWDLVNCNSNISFWSDK